MSHPELDDLKYPCNWDDSVVLSDHEKRQLVDRMVIIPKNWKKVVAKLHLAFCEYSDGDNAKARTHLVDAYSGILVPFEEMNACNVSILYRDAMKHVLDGMWAHLEMDEMEFDDDDVAIDEREYKQLMAFVSTITHHNKMDNQQQAALYAIRAALADYPENTKWAQKAIFTCPNEAQWYIDLGYYMWNENHDWPSFHDCDTVNEDILVTRQAVSLVRSGSPSHSLKRLPLHDILRKELGERWIRDLELLLLVGRAFLVPESGIIPRNRESCRQGACRNKKKCKCSPTWFRDMLMCAMFEGTVARASAPAPSGKVKDWVPVAVFLNVSLTALSAGFPDMALRGMQEASKMAPACQYIHHRLALLHLERFNSPAGDFNPKQAAALALDHAKRCERLYPMTLDMVREDIEDAKMKPVNTKPKRSEVKAGRRR